MIATLTFGPGRNPGELVSRLPSGKIVLIERGARLPAGFPEGKWECEVVEREKVAIARPLRPLRPNVMPRKAPARVRVDANGVAHEGFSWGDGPCPIPPPGTQPGAWIVTFPEGVPKWTRVEKVPTTDVQMWEIKPIPSPFPEWMHGLGIGARGTYSCPNGEWVRDGIDRLQTLRTRQLAGENVDKELVDAGLQLERRPLQPGSFGGDHIFD